MIFAGSLRGVAVNMCKKWSMYYIYAGFYSTLEFATFLLKFSLKMCRFPKTESALIGEPCNRFVKIPKEELEEESILTPIGSFGFRGMLAPSGILSVEFCRCSSLVSKRLCLQVGHVECDLSHWVRDISENMCPQALILRTGVSFSKGVKVIGHLCAVEFSASSSKEGSEGSLSVGSILEN
tara:strand:- start:77 stop:619 length:543 start_codon:yes stop_codon:yes gene_type:complete